MGDNSSYQTETVGTLQYMAPESMMQSVYSTASDIYSFGVVAWELFSESEAFQGKEGFELIDLVVNKKQKLPFESFAIDPQLKQLLSACMNFHSDTRPTANAICKALSNLTKKTN